MPGRLIRFINAANAANVANAARYPATAALAVSLVALTLPVSAIPLPSGASTSSTISTVALASPAWSLGPAGALQASCVRVTYRCSTRGTAVLAVQRSLRAKGYAVAVTGVYGASTGRAVVAFKTAQARRGNDRGSTPRVGIRTYAALTARSGGGGGGGTTPTPTPTPTPAVRCGTAAGRTCQSTAERVKFAGHRISARCPVLGATLGDGWGAGRGHQGVDLLITKAQYLTNVPIVAVEDGYILKSRRQDNGALVVQVVGVSGAGYYYGHQKVNLVAVGDRVKAGEVLGYVGDTGPNPGAFHLHFQFHPRVVTSVDGVHRWLGSPIDAAPFIRVVCF